MRPKVLVIGDGLVGLTALSALNHSELDLTWVGPNLNEGSLPDDFRSIVLNSTSKEWLDHWGLATYLADYLTPITALEISESGALSHCHFSAAKTTRPALGYVVPAFRLIEALRKGTEGSHATKIQGKVVGWSQDACSEVIIETPMGERRWQGDCLISCEGAHSSLREMQGLDVHTKCYDQVAITAMVTLKGQSETVAFERFSSDGSMAFLPRGKGRYGVVWIVSSEYAEVLMSFCDQAFLAALQHSFGTRLGLFSSLSKRVCYPLSLSWMPSRFGPNTIYLGNAAQSIHPVMGQGYNLGIRDLAAWVNFAEYQGWQVCSRMDHLLSYSRARESDRQRVIRYSEQIVSVFGSKFSGTRAARRLALSLLDESPSLKSWVMGASLGEAYPWLQKERE